MKQKWGQYELVDKASIQKIIDALDLYENDVVLEIGPGTGVLTLPIKEKVKRLIAVEIDRLLCEILKINGVEAINADFLKLDLKQVLSSINPVRGHPAEGTAATALGRSASNGVKIVSNLPYYITTPIITKILEEKVSFKSMVFTMQKEVAERLTAEPGTKDYGAISVFVQYHTQPQIIADVHRSCFRPIPNVDSCIVFFKKRRKISLGYPEDFLFKVVRAGFSTRRKMLKNVLRHFKGLDNTDIDLTRRAETLSLKEFCKLAGDLWPPYALLMKQNNKA